MGVTMGHGETASSTVVGHSHLLVARSKQQSFRTVSLCAESERLSGNLCHAQVQPGSRSAGFPSVCCRLVIFKVVSDRISGKRPDLTNVETNLLSGPRTLVPTSRGITEPLKGCMHDSILSTLYFAS